MLTTPKIFRKFLRDRDGAAAVEMAFIMPLLLIVIFAFFHVAIFFFSTHQAQRASERAGRDVRMLSEPSQSEIEDVLEERLNDPLGGTYKPVIQTLDENGGTFADIRIFYEYKLPIPLLDQHTFKSESGTRVLLRE